MEPKPEPVQPPAGPRPSGPPNPGPGSGGRSDGGWPFSGVTPDWADEVEWARMCAVPGWEDEPADPVTAFYEDPDCGPLPEDEQESWEALTARAEYDGTEYQALIKRLAAAGSSESAHVRGGLPVPGIPEGPAAGFGQGRPLDAAAPSTVVCGLADDASGEDRFFHDVTDDQLMGLIGARARLVSRQQWELLTAVAEFVRRRPHPDAPKDLLPGRMPEAASEDAGSDLAAQLHLTRIMSATVISLSHDLMVKLPMTRAALRDGVIDWDKARCIAVQCWPLDPGQARRAERILFGLGGIEEMTWGMIRDRIAAAVIEVDPDAARRRREAGQRQARVELFPELSGNMHISGRELPPAAALAADQNVNARARELRVAGVRGDMDHLRTLAYLEMLGAGSFLDYGHPAAAGSTSPPGDGPAGDDPAGDDPAGDDPAEPGGAGEPGDGTAGDGLADSDGPGEPGGGGNGGRGPGGPPPGTPGSPAGAGAVPVQVPPGFAAKVNLTIPLATLLGLAERPGTLSRLGPVDPELARTLAAAAARNPRSTWCITVTGTDHRPVAHGCGKPPPRQRRRGRGTPDPGPPDHPDHPDHPGQTGLAAHAGLARDGPARDGPGRTPAGDQDPPGTGTIRLDIAALAGTAVLTGTAGTAGTTGGGSELVFTLENLVGPCDHKYQAAGHDPGVTLRHLTSILNQCCTFMTCRRPHDQADYEHSTPYEKGGRTCLCDGGPVCRHNHRDKQAPGWRLQRGPNRGWFRWTTASGRTYTTKPTQYPD